MPFGCSGSLFYLSKTGRFLSVEDVSVCMLQKCSATSSLLCKHCLQIFTATYRKANRCPCENSVVKMPTLDIWLVLLFMLVLVAYLRTC